MHRTGCHRLRRLAAGCFLLVASGARAAEPDAAARAAELARSGRFEEAALAWRELAQDLAAEGRRGEQVSALVHLADAQQALGRYADSLKTLAACHGLSLP